VKLVHPGYGLISENSKAASLFIQNGIRWVGPSPETIVLLGSKKSSKLLALDNHVPTCKNSGVLKDFDSARLQAKGIGYPVILKCSNGGGGIGMFECRGDEDLARSFPIAMEKARTLFGGCEVFLEKYYEKAHHIEVQIFGDGQGKIWVLGHRECSIQRRNQKVIEETPSPFVNKETL
jgi:acetyl/propionyl-CoA carboxylase alpha subunit